MLQIVLVRPGATEYDQQGRIQGTLDMPLCEDGRKQVEAAVAQMADLNAVAVYAGPCEAAEQTAALIGKKLGLKVKKLDKLRNLDHGLWQGMLVDEVRTKQPRVYRQWQEQPETVCPPQGESVPAAKARVAEALKKLLKKHKEGVVVVVAPEPMGSLLRHVIQHDELSHLWKSPDNCGAWEMIEVPDEMIAGVA
ncbi:histidine phosphatase family protein [Botrimarina hoheduenensis]|uniref:Phosphoserine phosphatase 1 n=1 Tax=Botrimarina hoheduenensis TaxID=2528000 RepID=A0A5C5WAL5_9BACT|nr:histidine phosphatase family protein [Botrimarina hoheduenensis]TWT46642.1 Phosphoserine phosphatase 1 [Botrimarina hoheduenensis]